MLRYCFTTTDPSWETKVKELYSYLPVEITAISKIEGCIVSTDEEAKKDIEGQNGYLGSMPNYSRPLPVPEWEEMMRNNGPFITEEHYVQTITNIRHRKTNQILDISKQMELIIYSFLSNYRDDSTYIKNYKRYMNEQFGADPDDLDLSEFDHKALLIPQPEDDYTTEYKFVIIDGNPVKLSVFTTPMTRVDSSGEIIDGILTKDVAINYNKPSIFKTINSPGASWAYKWSDTTGKTYSKLLFELDEIEQDNNDSESDHSEQSEDLNSQYGSEDENDIIVDENEGKWVYVEYEKPDEEELDKPDASLLTTEELNLPLSYLKSKTDQWKIVQTCLTSNFRNNQYLSRVSDNVLKTVVHAIKYSIDSSNTVPNAAISILQYNSKRKGKLYKHVYDTLYNPNE